MTSAGGDAPGRLSTAVATFDDLFRRDAGHPLGRLFSDEAQLIWPEVPPIVGPYEISAAFAAFAEAFQTISYEPRYDLVEAQPPLAVVAGTFIEVRRDRATGQIERVHRRIIFAWRDEPERGWRCSRLMTSRYAESESLGVGDA